MEKLTTLCLDNIALNLFLNYRLIKESRVEIPNEIGEKIFENSLKIVSNLESDDLKIFNKEICSLKNVNLFRNQLKRIGDFNFLNEQELDNLYIGGVHNFKVDENNFSLKVKNLIYFMDSPNDLRKLRNLFKNLTVTDSIFIRASSLNEFKKLFDTLGDSIRAVELLYTNLSNDAFKYLMKKIKNKKSLTDLGINLESLRENENDESDLKKFLLFIPNTITKLHIQVDSCQTHIFSLIPSLIKSLINLEEFIFRTMPNANSLTSDLFDSIKEISNGNLKILGLTFNTINNVKRKQLTDLIEKCSFLKEIYIIEMENDNAYIDSNLLGTLRKCASNLEVLEMSGFEKCSLKRPVEKLIEKFSSLKAIDLGDYISMGLNEKHIGKMMAAIGETLKTLKITVCDFTSQLIKEINWENVSNLNRLKLEDIHFFGNSLEEFFKGLMTSGCGKTLKVFELKHFGLHFELSIAIGNFLSTCNCLEIVTFTNIFSGNPGEIVHILKGLKSCQNSLRQLAFYNCTLNDIVGYIIADIVRPCRHIESFTIIPQHLSGKCKGEILDSLKNSKKSLQIYKDSFYPSQISSENEFPLMNNSQDYLEMYSYQNQHLLT